MGLGCCHRFVEYVKILEEIIVERKKLRANLLLLLTAMIWGASFVALSVSVNHVGPFTLLFAKSILAGTVLLPVIWVTGRHRQKKTEKKPLLLGGAACGAVLFLASAFQQMGIQYTTAGKAGFITAMYVVLVPLVGLFLGKASGKRVWLSVAVALVGMYLLCFSGGSLDGLNYGDLLEMVCALGFTAHILVIDHFSGRVDGIQMSCVQFFVCGILAFFGMVLLETPTWAGVQAAWLPIVYTGVLSSGVGYTLQIVAQKDTDPTVASLLMSLESVFSLIFGWIILKEAMGFRELLGCGLIFAAILWVQLPDGKTAETH
jgi:drug/metabolite transporter (DMT)-like permease